ncbi:MAG: hypothetical protein Q4E11_07525 [Corynebacterium sp.]|uniref:hypothetical protein n=1 Tax=Corynebacterium sp. TaxID=1720 RepID=UPI0026DBE403|nr:hypothetical protein [Corynebacterium sp.]MDO5030417.1 hypothetical protein [Corynebacterium sp.]
MQYHSNTNIEHNSDTRTATQSKRPRRRAAHLIEHETKEGLQAKCGHFIHKQHIVRVGNPSEHSEYYPCKTCYTLDAAEKELEQDTALLLLSSIHSLTNKEK